MGIIGERLHHRLVERPGLVGPEQLSHGKYMRKGRFLQIAHHGVTLIDRSGDAWPVAVLGFDRLGQARVVGAQLEFVSAPLHREALFQDLEACLLTQVQRQFVMQHLVQFSAGRHGSRKKRAADEHAADRRDEARR